MGYSTGMAETAKTDDKNAEKTPEKPAPKTGTVVKEYGGPNGLEPTRYGDWEKKGRCIDF